MRSIFSFILIYFFSVGPMLAGGHSDANAFGVALKVPETEVARVERLL